MLLFSLYDSSCSTSPPSFLSVNKGLLPQLRRPDFPFRLTPLECARVARFLLPTWSMRPPGHSSLENSLFPPSPPPLFFSWVSTPLLFALSWFFFQTVPLVAIHPLNLQNVHSVCVQACLFPPSQARAISLPFDIFFAEYFFFSIP